MFRCFEQSDAAMLDLGIGNDIFIGDTDFSVLEVGLFHNLSGLG